MTAFAALLALSAAGFFCSFRACSQAYARSGDVPPLWLVPLAVNAGMVLLTTALLLKGAAQ